MATINKHNIKMAGLKKAAGETKGLRGYYSGEYVELFYAPQTGEVWTVYQYSLGQNTLTVYDDPNVVKVGNICSKTTMQEIADIIARRMAEITAIQKIGA